MSELSEKFFDFRDEYWGSLAGRVKYAYPGKLSKDSGEEGIFVVLKEGASTEGLPETYKGASVKLMY